MVQAIAPNAFFVFAGTFPTNNAIANLLLGAPVTFYQGLGDFSRERQRHVARRVCAGRVARRPARHAELRASLRADQPFIEAEDRLNGFIPGVQSSVRPDAPVGLVFPGDPGIGARHRAERQRLHAARRGGLGSDRHGHLVGAGQLRPLLRPVSERLRHRVAGGDQRDAVGAVQPVQRRRAQLSESLSGTRLPAPNTFVRPSTVFALDADARPPSVQNWNVSVQRSLFDKYLVEVRYVGAAGRNLPRNVEANPAVFGPGATAQNADRRRIYANCPADGGTCDFSTVAMLRNITRSNYQAGQASLSRRFGGGIAFNASYWYSKIVRLSVGDEPLRRRGQAARRRERPRAEPVRSGCRVRPVALRCAASLRRQRELEADGSRPRAGGGAGDLRRMAAERRSPRTTRARPSRCPIRPTSRSRPTARRSRGSRPAGPNVVGDPNGGPRTVDEWLSRSAFRRLNVQTEAGQFGNAGRNIARGPSYTNVDMSLVRDVRLSGETRLQFRAEVFNVANHANFGLPVADLNSVNFGRIFSAARAAADAVRGEGDLLVSGPRRYQASERSRINTEIT